MSNPVWVACSDISVASSIPAPASSTNDAAICVTAKARSRRLVPDVIRRLPLDRPKPCDAWAEGSRGTNRSEEHTSELQSHSDLVCRLLLEKKKQDAQNGRAH